MPLTFSWSLQPMHELLEELVATPSRRRSTSCTSRRRPRSERAQALLSAKFCTREERDAIADAIGDFRFTAGFGRTLSKLIRSGIGVHHAGMLPRYRRLVEQLVQRGLLKVICGTDTLGVGINVPIRTVVFTGLAKFDGTRIAAAEGARVPSDRGPCRAAGVRHDGLRRRAGRPSTRSRTRGWSPRPATTRRSSSASSARSPRTARSPGPRRRSRGCATPSRRRSVSRMRVNHALILNVINQRAETGDRAARAARGQPRGRARPGAAGRAGRVAAGGAARVGRARAARGGRRVRPHPAARARAAGGLRAQPAAGVLRARGLRPDRGG